MGINSNFPKFTKEDVIEAVKRDFPDDCVKRITENLDSFRPGFIEEERIRVWMAIIMGSRRDEKELNRLLSEAKIDHTKILFENE